jgi:hypothetical protein
MGPAKIMIHVMSNVNKARAYFMMNVSPNFLAITIIIAEISAFAFDAQ